MLGRHLRIRGDKNAFSHQQKNFTKIYDKKNSIFEHLETAWRSSLGIWLQIRPEKEPFCRNSTLHYRFWHILFTLNFCQIEPIIWNESIQWHFWSLWLTQAPELILTLSFSLELQLSDTNFIFYLEAKNTFFFKGKITPCVREQNLKGLK